MSGSFAFSSNYSSPRQTNTPVVSAKNVMVVHRHPRKDVERVTYTLYYFVAALLAPLHITLPVADLLIVAVYSRGCTRTHIGLDASKGKNTLLVEPKLVTCFVEHSYYLVNVGSLATQHLGGTTRRNLYLIR